MAICSGDCYDQGCKMIAECEHVYKGSHPPCSDIAESTFSASGNTARNEITALIKELEDITPSDVDQGGLCPIIERIRRLLKCTA